MSEPVSNVEIEDVLSSIRRLVSEENRPELRRKPKDAPNKPTRLVLTPSLLVPGTDATEALGDAGADTGSDTGSDTEHEPTIAPEATDPQATTVDAAQDVEAVSEAASEMGADPDSATEFTAEDAASDGEVFSPANSEPEAEVDVFADTESGTETGTETDSETDHSGPFAASDQNQQGDPHLTQTPWVDPDATLFAAADTLEAPQSDDDADKAGDDSQPHDDETLVPQSLALEAAEPEAAQPEEDQADDTDSTLSAPVASDWPEGPATHEDTPSQDHSDVADDLDLSDETADPDFSDPVETPAQSGSTDIDGPDSDPFAADPLNTATLSDKIAALEARIGETQDQWEPDGETDDDYAGTPVETIQWQDHEADIEADGAPTQTQPDAGADREATAAAPDQTEPQDDDDILDILPEDDTILDEESLRELVADIVRQELQGALGERITRNVRKLVRREIHRALTAQELD